MRNVGAEKRGEFFRLQTMVALSTLEASSYDVGTLVYVDETSNYYSLQASDVSDGITRIDAAEGNVWVRCLSATGAAPAPTTPSAPTQNNAAAVYAIDGSGPESRIVHEHAGPTSYVLPAPTEGRTLELQDITGAIETPPNTVFIVPFSLHSINGSSSFELTGSGDGESSGFHFTNGSPIVSVDGGQFTTQLAVGMSIRTDIFQRGVNYIVASIESDTSLTLATNYTGETTTHGDGLRTSVTFAANFGRLSIEWWGSTWWITLIRLL